MKVTISRPLIRFKNGLLLHPNPDGVRYKSLGVRCEVALNGAFDGHEWICLDMEQCPPEFKAKTFIEIFHKYVTNVDDTDWVIEYIRKMYKGSLTLVEDGGLTMITTTGSVTRIEDE